MINSALSEMLLAATQFCNLVCSQRKPSTKHVLRTFALAVNELLVALFHVLSLGFISQFIYVLQQREQLFHTVAYDGMANFVARLYLLRVKRLWYLCSLHMCRFVMSR